MSFKQKDHGQGLIEFALLLPILLLLIVGALELGRMLQLHIVVTSAAREGAYYLSYTDNEDNSNCNVSHCFLGTIQAVQAEGNNSGVSIQPADITVTGCAGGASQPACQNGTTITVTVAQQARIGIFRFFYGVHPITHSVRMVVQ